MSGPLASLDDFEAAAAAVLSPMALDYARGGAGDELTLRWNRDAYQDLMLRSRVLVDVAALDTAVQLLGLDLPHPVIIAPTAYHKLLHGDGEIATAHGASEARALLTISSFATTPLESITSATTSPTWFQLYVQPDRDFTRDMIQRAEAAGCRAIVVTVDTPVLGARNRETRTSFALPEGIQRENLIGLSAGANAAHRPAEGQIYTSVLDPRMTWKEIAWLRSIATVPVVLKGIMDADDARLAMDAGVDGIVVSNHGGRNLDTVPATITALPRIAETIGGRIPVLIDGGIRRGTDVLKAIALGASAVMIGRPVLYGLAVDGAAGVAQVVNLLRIELQMAMALTGKTTIGAIDRSVLWT
jgi:4-hydroxymandelate oxidase